MSPSELVRFGAQVVFVIFNLTVIVYVLRARRKDSLDTGFYALFIAVSTSEVTLCVTWMLMSQIPNTLGLAQQFAEIVPCRAFMVHQWCLIFQAFLHLAIAFNRFSCFCGRLPRLELLWTGRGIVLLILALLLFAALFPIYSYWPSCSFILVEGRLLGAISADWTMQIASIAVIAIVYTVSSIVSFTLSIGTVVCLVLIIRRGGLLAGSKWREVRLFAYSLVMLLLQSVYAGIFASRLPIFGKSVVSWLFSLAANYGAGDAYLLLGPLFLLILSRNVRQGYLTYYGLKKSSNTQTTSVTALGNRSP